ncbi:MAG: hypothetical protein ABIL14_01315 [candidate division WOR-3 bacterium]
MGLGILLALLGLELLWFGYLCAGMIALLRLARDYPQDYLGYSKVNPIKELLIWPVVVIAVRKAAMIRVVIQRLSGRNYEKGLNVSPIWTNFDINKTFPFVRPWELPFTGTTSTTKFYAYPTRPTNH